MEKPRVHLDAAQLRQQAEIQLQDLWTQADQPPATAVEILRLVHDLRVHRIEYLAYHDALTQLPNRVLLTDRLQQSMAQARRDQQRLAVCYLDLNGFKAINDTWGHTCGDGVLIEVARRTRDNLQRIQDGLAAHEFRLYYQPKVEMRSGTVVGAEALIRWQHPDEGLLLPARFMPIVDASPLAMAVGQWVLGCNFAQGYGIAHPMPPEQIPAWIAGWAAPVVWTDQ